MFEFTEDDLKANKRGQLSASQRDWLKGVGQGGVRVQGFNVWIAIGFLFLGLCLILAMFLQNEDTRAALFANPLNFWIFPILIVVVLGVLGLSLLLARWNANKLQNAALSSASGNVSFDRDSSGESGITTYYVIVGRKKFKVTVEKNLKNIITRRQTVRYCGHAKGSQFSTHGSRLARNRRSHQARKTTRSTTTCYGTASVA